MLWWWLEELQDWACSQITAVHIHLSAPTNTHVGDGLRSHYLSPGNLNLSQLLAGLCRSWSREWLLPTTLFPGLVAGRQHR
jgi:hypothetical protein